MREEEVKEVKLGKYTLSTSWAQKFFLSSEGGTLGIYGDIIGDYVELGIQLYPRIWSLLQFEIFRVHEDKEHIYLAIKMLHLNKLMIVQCPKEWGNPHKVLHYGKLGDIYDIEELRKVTESSMQFEIYEEDERYLVLTIRVTLYDDVGFVYRHAVDIKLKKLRLGDKEVGVELSTNLYKSSLPGSLRDITEDVLEPEIDYLRDQGVIIG